MPKLNIFASSANFHSIWQAFQPFIKIHQHTKFQIMLNMVAKRYAIYNNNKFSSHKINEFIYYIWFEPILFIVTFGAFSSFLSMLEITHRIDHSTLFVAFQPNSLYSYTCSVFYTIKSMGLYHDVSVLCMPVFSVQCSYVYDYWCSSFVYTLCLNKICSHLFNIFFLFWILNIHNNANIYNESSHSIHLSIETLIGN